MKQVRQTKDDIQRTSLDLSDCEPPDGKTPWPLLVGIFLVSSGMLAYEITVTRILSVILFYHYVFIVISMALLGLGLGAIFVRVLSKIVLRGNRQYALPLFSSLLALSVPLSLILMARISLVEGLQDNTLLYFLAMGVPFFFAGALFAEVFCTFPGLSSRLYGADLAGAAVGAVGVVFALNILGGIKAVMAISLLILIAALIYAFRAIRENLKRVYPITICLLLLLSLTGSIVAGFGLGEMRVGATDKEMSNLLNEPSLKAKIVETRWSAFGRTDVLAFDEDPTQMSIFIDGTAGTPMFQFNGDIKNPDPKIKSLQTEFPGYLALSGFLQRDRNNVLIIGPGGGRDVLLAQMAGFANITAVEVNQDTVDIVRKYSQYNGGIYDAKNVSIVVDEGRSFLRRQNEKYDTIILSLPITKTTRSLEGYALTENFLFTTESITDYLGHLSDSGRLVVVAHDVYEIIRLLSLSLESLNQMGIDNQSAMRQVLIIGSHHFPAFVLKKTPFESGEVVSIHQSIHDLGYDPALSYLPSVTPVGNVSHVGETGFDKCSTFNSLFVATSQGKVNFADVYSSAAENGIDISPVTDNKPFFYKAEPGTPQAVTMVFWLSIVTLVVTSLIFLVRQKNRRYSSESRKIHPGLTGNLLRFIILFSMLGAGFMLVEISLFQRFILFLGQPVLSMAVMLASLLLGAGIGSTYTNRFTAAEKIARVLIIISPIIVVTLLLYALVLPVFLNQLLGLELTFRLLTTGLVLLPLGFLMGFPFPLGMKLLKEKSMEDTIPWMWGINGISSVVGSAVTIITAMSLGFTSALILGAVCYFVVSLMFLQGRKLARTKQRTTETS